ncbi:MAG: class I SAM-dependent methyltransferase [Syntrophales bacterium]
MVENIEFKSKEIQAYYSCNRSSWEEFYPSERWVFEKLAGEEGFLGDVLDVGCACGGLGVALCQKFHLRSYTGVDINRGAIEWAQQEQGLPVPATFMAGDINELNLTGPYDVVASLSCADWNIKTDQIIEACWGRVKAGGYLVISLRLTTGPGVNDIQTSYQYINFSGQDTAAEVANYVVFNFPEILHNLKLLQPAPALIGAYGYWGLPSATAVTPFTRLVFAVFYLKKGTGGDGHGIEGEFTLPLDIFL